MKKLQIFVSSTYLDLKAERQAAVEAILTAGHIPAGMELFTAGDESQLEIIYRWIDESDLFALILGGRYGSIEEKSGKSYTHLEYEYALKKKKKPFAIIMSDAALDAKTKAVGPNALELTNRDKYEAFKKTVKTHQSGFFADTKDIQLELHKTIGRFAGDHEFAGWVRASSDSDVTALQKEISRLSQENGEFRAELAKARAKAVSEDYNGLTFEELHDTLAGTAVQLSAGVARDLRLASTDVLTLFFELQDELVRGVTPSAARSDPHRSYLLVAVATKLIPFGLVEEKSKGPLASTLFQTTALGNKFLALLAHQRSPLRTAARSPTPAARAGITTVNPAKKKKKNVR